MTAKFVLSGVTMTATLIIIWQVSQAGWVRPPAKPPEIRSATDGPGVGTHRPESVIAEGRLVTYPGAEIVIATELAGTIVQLPVRENSAVRKGDLIVELQSDELRASRDEAIARIEEAEAEIRFYEREVERRRVLIARRAASDVELDTNQRGLDVSRARHRAAVAARRRYDALIAKTRIVSPIDGVVVARFAHPGETVEAAARLVTVADLKRVRIEAEVDEVDIGGVALGGEAVIATEGFPGRTWRGRVEEIPSVVVGRRLRPEDTARPVDTRVLLVKIVLLEPTPLKLGQRIEVEILQGSR
jgi:HlyD family secretion protein